MLELAYSLQSFSQFAKWLNVSRLVKKTSVNTVESLHVKIGRRVISAGAFVSNHLLPMSRMAMFLWAFCRVSTSQSAKWLKVSLLRCGAHKHDQGALAEITAIGPASGQAYLVMS